MLEEKEDWTRILENDGDRTKMFFDILKEYSHGEMPLVDRRMGYTRVGDLHIPLDDYYDLQQNFIQGHISIEGLHKLLDYYKGVD